MIRFQNVSKIYPNGTVALKNVSLTIAREEFVFLVGSNGAGKSTLLRMLYRAEKPSHGDVFVDQINVAKIPRHKVPFLRRNIGIVFQDYKLLPNRTVFENVAFALQVIGAPQLQIKKKVYQMLELVGLTKKADSYPREISGGEQQKVCIARALVNSPKILLADEPTGNLAPEATWEIIQLLNRINLRNTTVIVATHDQSIIDSTQKRVITVSEGQILNDDRVQHAL
jgi:cell division transport system ATP-binding protein